MDELPAFLQTYWTLLISTQKDIVNTLHVLSILLKYPEKLFHGALNSYLLFFKSKNHMKSTCLIPQTCPLSHSK